MKAELSCPVDHIPINENQVRLNALVVFLLSLTFLFVSHWIIPFFLAVDFYLRGFGFGGYSPINRLSGWIVKIASIPNKPIDRAPKQFAAQLGFFISDILLIAVVVELKSISYAIAGLLLLFAFLE